MASKPLIMWHRKAMENKIVEAMATKFSPNFAISVLKKHRKFCRRGLTHLNATPTFKNHSDLWATLYTNVQYCRKLKIPNFVRPNLWESLTSQYSHNSSALIAQPRENLSDKC